MQVSPVVSGMRGFGADLKREAISPTGEKMTFKRIQRLPPRILNGSSVSASQSTSITIGRNSPTDEGPKETIRF
jgi:hypothetical protein